MCHSLPCPHVVYDPGFDKPILHGLCFFGIATWNIVKHLCGGDVSTFRGIKARFSSHVFPGETVVTDMWRDDRNAGRVLFQCRTADRGTVVLTNGVCELAVAAGVGGVGPGAKL